MSTATLTANSQTMATSYGGDFGDFSVQGFVWAAQATLQASAPAANWAGTWIHGRIKYSSFVAGVTIGQLIHIGQDSEGIEVSASISVQNE